jgi:hypothetical protein
MRRFFIFGWMILCALAASAQEAGILKELPEGGFAPQGTGFQATFHFADLKRVSPPATARALGSWEPGMEWSDGHGARARLEICSVKQELGLGTETMTLAAARLVVFNSADHPWASSLSVEIAPDNAIYALAVDRHAFFVEGRPVLVADTPSRGAILADAPFAVRPLAPQQQGHVESARGQCRGEMIYDLSLNQGQTQTLGFLVPVHVPKDKDLDLDFYRAISVEEIFEQAKKEAGRK